METESEIAPLKEHKERKKKRYTNIENIGVLQYVLTNIAKHRMRTIFTIIGISVPIAFFVLFAAMGEGLDQYLIDQAELEQQNREDYIEMAKIVNSWTETLMLIIAIMIVTSIANTILMSATERKIEFGILKAVGISQDQLVYIVLTEAVIISIFALIVGIILGFWGAILFDYMFWLDEGAGFFFAPAKITYDSILIVTILTLFIGTITAYYPAVMASKGNMIDILRYE